MSLREERDTQTVYTGSLLNQELHPVPRSHWETTKHSKQIIHKTTKEVTLNPSRNTLPLAQHTPRMLILTTSRAHNTPWQQHQNLESIQNELHLFTEQSEINTDVILFHPLLRKPKT